MKPSQIFLFFIAVLSGLGLLMLIFPQDGIKIGDVTLQFETWNDFLHPIENKDITKIVENNDLPDEDTVETTVAEPVITYDTAYIDGKIVLYQSVSIDVDSTTQKIDFPAGNKHLLDNFFASLLDVKNKGKKVHILHYGDSQIEADRMSSYFRYRLQKQFGGFGCGFHPGLQAFDFKAPMIVSYSDNWIRYKVFPKKDTIVKHRRFGILPWFSQFVPINDTSNQTQSAWIAFQKSPVGYYNTRNYTNVSLFYGHNLGDVNLKIYSDQTEIYNGQLPESQGLHISKWHLSKAPQELKFVYTGSTSPEIYGYCFESNSGVFVDNFGIRGSGGLFFGKISMSLFAQIAKNLNTKLILLQFGGNALSDDSTWIKNYVRYFGAQIKYIKRVLPDVPIIVLGPADMSQKYKNNYITRPTLPYLVTLMKAEVLKQNCAFWNMYEAMGGRNSMPSWVFHNPPLAGKDFIHFTNHGAKIIAMMFYKSLMLEYNNYLKRTIKN